jgi:hypothetical protein
MLKFSPEQRREIMAAADVLTMQVIARVPLYQNAAGTVLVPLHPLLDTVELDLLLEATALTLLRPQTYRLAQGATGLMVPLGEAFALLPFSRHFPDALSHVVQLAAEAEASAARAATEGPTACASAIRRQRPGRATTGVKRLRRGTRARQR